jgi:hypothetical protein
MRTDHYLLEERENEALHQTNLYARRMKLPVNRHIESDQTKNFFAIFDSFVRVPRRCLLIITNRMIWIILDIY